MLITQKHINYPICIIPKSPQEGIKLGILIEKLKKMKVDYTVLIENSQTNGIKIDLEKFINKLTFM